MGDAGADVGYRGGGDCSCDGTDGGEHGSVDGAGIVVEEGAQEFLDLLLSVGESGVVVGVVAICGALCGECSGHVGGVCWNRLRALLTY